MKRINERKMVANQTDDYSHQKVEPIDFEKFRTEKVGVPYRYKWASDIVDKLKSEGSVCYNYLDIGTYNGTLALIMADKLYTTIDRISVDAVEACKECAVAANIMAESAAKKGLKIQIHNVKFEDYETDKVYSVITAFEILEHTRDPLFCIEKIYDLLEIGGHLMLTVPEQGGTFGLKDKNKFHYWTSTVQSVVFMFHDDLKWKIEQIFEQDGLIHMLVQKKTYME